MGGWIIRITAPTLTLLFSFERCGSSIICASDGGCDRLRLLLHTETELHEQNNKCPRINSGKLDGKLIIGYGRLKWTFESIRRAHVELEPVSHWFTKLVNFAESMLKTWEGFQVYPFSDQLESKTTYFKTVVCFCLVFISALNIFHTATAAHIPL